MGNETSMIIKALLEEVLSKEIHPVLQNLHQAQLDNRRVFRMMAEMVTGMEVMSKLPDAVSVFGSARSKPRDSVYKHARWIGKRFAEEGYAVITGGGPGVMEAANRGAAEAKGLSVGLNISLPFEQSGNPYISRELEMEFHYFFMRKYWFVYLAKALIAFPGGFGTFDELFETLTLIQRSLENK